MAFLLIPGVKSNVGSFIDASGKQKRYKKKQDYLESIFETSQNNHLYIFHLFRHGRAH